MPRIPDLSEVPDLEIQPEGEYNLRIVSAKDVISNNTGREGIMMVISNLDADNAPNIFHRIWFPMEGDDEHKANNMWRMIKELLQSLGLPTTGCDPQDFVGIEFQGLVAIEKDQNEQDQNVLKRVTG
jgi:hypothetical protein